MFINLEKKFIYIRPPKVASSTLIDFFWKDELSQSILIEHNRISPNCFGRVWVEGYDQKRRDNANNLHPKMSEISNYLNKKSSEDASYSNNFDDYRIVTSIRNPYKHALSWYLFQKLMYDRRVSRGINFEFALNNPARFLAQRFFSSHGKTNFKIFLRYFYRPYTDWFTLNGKNVVTDYIRVEHLQEDLKNFCNKVQLKYETPTSININKKHNEELYSKFFDTEAKKLIEKRYKDILEKHDYKCP